MRVYLWNLQPLGLSPLLYMPSPWSFSPYRALVIVVQVQPSTKAFPCTFELPDHVPHLDWTLWNADLTFKAASMRNRRSTCLLGHQGFSSIILKRKLLLRKENSRNSSHSHKNFHARSCQIHQFPISCLRSYYWIRTEKTRGISP